MLTTSYPRYEGDYAERFVADAVERLRARGVEIDVLAPGAGYRDYGLAYGGGLRTTSGGGPGRRRRCSPR